MSATKLSGIEQAFEAFVDRVEGAIRRMPASEVAAERERVRAELIARHFSVMAKAPNVPRRRPDWSRLGLNVAGLVAVLVFIAVWALTALMGGLWGFLLGWLPASIIARFCFYAWPLVLAVVVIAGFGVAAVVKQSTAPAPAADPYDAVSTPAPAVQASAQAAPADASSSAAGPWVDYAPAPAATPAAQVAAAAPPTASEPPAPAAPPPAAAPSLRNYTFTYGNGETVVVQAADPYSGIALASQRYAAEHGVPLPLNTPDPTKAHKPISPQELDALVAACPTHTFVYDSATDGLVCPSPAYPGAPVAAPPNAQSAPEAPAPNVSAPVPAASDNLQVARR